MTRRKPPEVQAIRERVEQARLALGWSYYRLAKASGVPAATVRQYLVGHSDTGTENADAMLAAMAAAKKRS